MLRTMKVNKTKIGELGREHDLRFIVLFGSQATGSQREDSDFDIAVYTDDLMKDMTRYSHILGSLSEAFSVSEDKIDITDLKRADPLLRKKVVESGKLLYGNQKKYTQFKIFALNDFIDHKPLFELESKLIKKRQAIFRKRYA